MKVFLYGFFHNQVTDKYPNDDLHFYNLIYSIHLFLAFSIEIAQPFSNSILYK